MSLGDRLRFLLVTSCGLGLSPVAPGTVGTLGGVILAVVLQASLGGTPGYLGGVWFGVAGFLFLLGCRQTAFVQRTFPNEDPGAFVLDEVVGYLATVATLAVLAQRLPDALAHSAAFFAFRVFDVWKPQPARKLEDLPGAIGIMADDLMAGVYAGLSLYFVLPFFGW